jgi:hypothetical protein
VRAARWLATGWRWLHAQVRFRDVVMVALIGASILYSAHQISQLERQQQASCAFASDVGSVPLPDSPRPSKLGVSLVTDARAQWRELHCPGALAPSPGLAKWAAYYHLAGS